MPIKFSSEERRIICVVSLQARRAGRAGGQGCQVQRGSQCHLLAPFR